MKSNSNIAIKPLQMIKKDELTGVLKMVMSFLSL